MSERSNKPLTLAPEPEPNAPEEARRAERRADPRYPFTAAAEVFDMLSETQIMGRTSDLGTGGCYIDTLCPFAVGSVVRVRLEHAVHEFKATAMVTHSSAPLGMGLTFTEIQAEHQAVLNAWVNKLRAGQSLEPEATSDPESDPLAAVVNLRSVLKELICLMVRKKIISENEGAGLMRQMFR